MLRVGCVCPRVLCSSGRAVDVGVVPSLLPALDHAARVVVGTDAVVNLWPWRERGGYRSWGWRAARVGLPCRWGALHFGWLSPTVARATGGTRGSGLPGFSEELSACWTAASSTMFLTWR